MLILASAVVLSVSTIVGCGTSGNAGLNTDTPSNGGLIQAPGPGGLETITERAAVFAAQQLALYKSFPEGFTEPLGITESELAGMALGDPFTIYVFDNSWQIVEYDNLAFPLFYQDSVIAVMEVGYIADSDEFSASFGKSFADKLDELHNKYKDDDLIIANYDARLLFATNGNEATVFILHYGGEIIITADQIKNVMASISEAVDKPRFFRFPASD